RKAEDLVYFKESEKVIEDELILFELVQASVIILFEYEKESRSNRMQQRIEASQKAAIQSFTSFFDKREKYNLDEYSRIHYLIDNDIDTMSPIELYNDLDEWMMISCKIIREGDDVEEKIGRKGEDLNLFCEKHLD
ncbi:MAG: hypothetical protein F6K30_06140, partial [Cyanothece sp. SIO2G6]|nr:hypothetical protein [Cyanothece sp. SIO2G6]